MDPNSAPHSIRKTLAFSPASVWSPAIRLAAQGIDYGIDAWQRSILLLDVFRQRGNAYNEIRRRAVPHVLSFEFEVVMRGAELPRPVNYALIRILPPPGVQIDARRRPFIVFDPRAGHGPGIGGMKHDSEIGVALAAGHPCYFVGFLPEPVPGQTVLDVCRAHALFIDTVAGLHPDAEGKPCLIGNCQAGWQIMMTAALNPQSVGPILLAGAPLSFWAGIRGRNPMRYLGGMWAGSWATSLLGDLGNGIFDGANLIANFEYLDPANTYWSKTYNVYSKIDTEPPRFLEFEKWWGSPILLNAEEMRYIVGELFIGNKLASGELSDGGLRIDLRNIQSPVVVFCSHGDNITPPQQALDWILDLYETTDDISTSGQTIIYSLHQSIGHLGIFVSAKVATKEHQEFTRNMDLIDVLPPGLYEAVISDLTSDEINPKEVAADNYVIRFEVRTLDDIRALGVNSSEDDRCFASVARISDVAETLYKTYFAPAVKHCTNEGSAELLRQLHPVRLKFSAFSDENPFMRPIESVAPHIHANRRAVDETNPFTAMERFLSGMTAAALDIYRDLRDGMIERTFLSIYGSPLVQAMAGVQAEAHSAVRSLRDLSREVARATAVAQMETQFYTGGLCEASIRALIYVGSGREMVGVDARSFEELRTIRAEQPVSRAMSLTAFKVLVRQQHQLLHADEGKALSSLLSLIEEVPAKDREAIPPLIRRIIEAGRSLDAEMERRFSVIESLFLGSPKTSKVSMQPIMGEFTPREETVPPEIGAARQKKSPTLGLPRKI